MGGGFLEGLQWGLIGGVAMKMQEEEPRVTITWYLAYLGAPLTSSRCCRHLCNIVQIYWQFCAMIRKNCGKIDTKTIAS